MHEDGLTDNFIVRFNISLACQTYRFQLDLLVFDAAGMEFGDCIKFRKQMLIGSINIVSSCTFFFAYLVIQRLVTSNRRWTSRRVQYLVSKWPHISLYYQQFFSIAMVQRRADFFLFIQKQCLFCASFHLTLHFPHRKFIHLISA